MSGATLVDPQAALALAQMQRTPAAPLEAGSPVEARRIFDAGRAGLQGDRETVASVEDRTIEGPDGTVALRIYRGQGAPSADAPSLLYLHGGGWVVGNLESHDEVCRWFANLAACVVICPDYRLAPEHKFPAAVDDCLAVLGFMRSHQAELGIDARRIAVAGDSAGGNLAAVVALTARDDANPLAAQLLIYPNTDASQTADSYHRYAQGYGLTAVTMAWFRDHYVRDVADIDDWRVSPLKAASLAGAPPAFVAIAGLDILADEGEAYASRLVEDGVRVTVRRWPGQIHGFVSMGRHGPVSREAVAAAVEFWRAAETGRAGPQAD